MPKRATKSKGVSRSKRIAASHICFSLFHITNHVTHQLRAIADVRSDIRGSGALGLGLTPNEREYVDNLASTFHELGEKLRLLGQRFKRST